MCGRAITAQAAGEQILAGILMALLAGNAASPCFAPVIRGQKGEYKDLFAVYAAARFRRRARVDGEVVRLSDDLKLDRRIKHNIEIVVDRLKIDAQVRTRLAEAVEQALVLGEGALIVSSELRNAERERGTEEEPKDRSALRAPSSEFEDILFSAHYACTHCNRSYEPPSPQLFSFNSPHGMYFGVRRPRHAATPSIPIC